MADHPFASPSDDAAPSEYDGPWILASQVVLVFTGSLYGLLGVLAGGTYTLVPLLLAEEDPAILVMIPFGLLMLAMGVGLGALNIGAAWGLGQRRMWAWVVGVILAFLYLPSLCMPLGAVLAWGLLVDEPTRREFLK